MPVTALFPRPVRGDEYGRYQLSTDQIAFFEAYGYVADIPILDDRQTEALRTELMAHLTCWIGLDDATRENGCVHYVPGSHRWGLLPKPALAGDVDAIAAALTSEQRDRFKPVAIELHAGEASFHHPLMLHGSY